MTGKKTHTKEQENPKKITPSKPKKKQREKKKPAVPRPRLVAKGVNSQGVKALKLLQGIKDASSDDEEEGDSDDDSDSLTISLNLPTFSNLSTLDQYQLVTQELKPDKRSKSTNTRDKPSGKKNKGKKGRKITGLSKQEQHELDGEEEDQEEGESMGEENEDQEGEEDEEEGRGEEEEEEGGGKEMDEQIENDEGEEDEDEDEEEEEEEDKDKGDKEELDSPTSQTRSLPVRSGTAVARFNKKVPGFDALRQACASGSKAIPSFNES
ncbi:hypothetical protein JCM16303_000502 [Sporobolomyces ruberrimus]